MAASCVGASINLQLTFSISVVWFGDRPITRSIGRERVCSLSHAIRMKRKKIFCISGTAWLSSYLLIFRCFYILIYTHRIFTAPTHLEVGAVQ